MIRRLTGDLPAWAQRHHPVLRYELDRLQPPSRRGRVLLWAGGVVLALLLFGLGYLLATGGLAHAPGMSLAETVHHIVYWPLLVVQLVAGFIAFTLTANVVGDEVRRRHWDSLRSTPDGVALSLRARWAAIFYRLRPLLAAILIVRVVLILLIFYDLTGFQGRYLDLLMNGITPELPLAGGVLLLALLMTAALLAPFTSLGLDAAFGLLLSAHVRQQPFSVVLQLLLLLVRLFVVAGLAQLLTQFMTGALTIERPVSAALVGGYAALGDGGLALLDLGLFGDLWVKAPWSILVCVGLLVFVLVQALLADWLVALAVRRAEQHD